MRLGYLGIVASLLLAGCASHASIAALLPIERIRIDTADGPKTFNVEVAADMASQQRGLMYRQQLAADAGMLFDFHRDGRVAFWMKNTPLPLDMLFIRGDGTVASVQPNTKPYSVDTIPSREPVRAVLEINGGQALALGIRPGDRVRGAIFADRE
ncbi:MAG: DUF192 domain-containing protein [Proteobacteria bacterium]|nr:DUF192 domain-containing protein [Pseudomonadota bacterium]